MEELELERELKCHTPGFEYGGGAVNYGMVVATRNKTGGECNCSGVSLRITVLWISKFLLNETSGL